MTSAQGASASADGEGSPAAAAEAGVRATWLAFSICAAFVAAGFGWVAWQSRGLPEDVPIARLLPLFLLLPIPALTFAALLPRLPKGRGLLFALFVVGVVLRLFFIAHSPFLSDDVYRYLWDGRVQEAGFLPYGVPPSDPSLDSVEAGWPEEARVRELVNHPEVATVYPPLMELLFAGVAQVGGGLIAWRLLLLAAELGIAGLIVRGLRVRSLDPRLVVLYLWHPLPVFESTWSAHTEAIAVFFLLAAIVVVPFDRLRVRQRSRRCLMAAIALGLGGAAKLLPLGFLPWLMFRASREKKGRTGETPPLGRSLALTASCGFLCLLAVGVTTLPFVGTDLDQATSGLEAYTESWYFNDMVFRPVGFALGLNPEDRTLASTQILRRVLQGLGALLCLFVAWKAWDAWRAGLWIATSFVVLMPTLHPWYLLWLLPFAIVKQSRAGLLLSFTVLASYVVQVGWREQGVWSELPLVRWIEFLPPLVLFGYECMARRRTKSA